MNLIVQVSLFVTVIIIQYILIIIIAGYEE